MYKRIFLLVCIFFWFFFAFSEESTYQQNYQNFPVIETFSKTDFFPTITELSSKNPIFKQFSQDVEINYKKIALEKETNLMFYKYRATKDDTLHFIAARCNISYDSIATLNHISSIHSDISGKILLIPTVPGLFVPKNGISTIEKIMLCRNFDTSEILCYNINNEEFYFLENTKFDETERMFFLNDNIRSPLPNGILSSRYGLRNSPISGKPLFHNGIDLAAELNSPVLSCLSGKVLECNYNDVYGNYVVILHDNNMKSFYAHLSSFACEKGAYVTTGQIIGYVGLTGLTTGPHLHFEVYVSGQTKDPWELIN